jgi:hypothetical protein
MSERIDQEIPDPSALGNYNLTDFEMILLTELIRTNCQLISIAQSVDRCSQALESLDRRFNFGED